MKQERNYPIDRKQHPQPVGARVRGVFYGKHYRGVVVSSTPHSRTLAHIHQVRVDDPITVFGVVRDIIHVSIWEPAPNGNTIEAEPNT